MSCWKSQRGFAVQESKRRLPLFIFTGRDEWIACLIYGRFRGLDGGGAVHVLLCRRIMHWAIMRWVEPLDSLLRQMDSR